MITEKDKLSDVIGRNIDLLPIVHRLGLSSYIRENTIHEACRLKGIDLRFTLGVVNTFSAAGYLPKPEDMDLVPLIDFLTKTHDYHKQVTIPRIYGLIDQMKLAMPGEKLLIVVEKYLNQYIEKLITHIDFEEHEIFPLVVKKHARRSKAVAPNLKKLLREHTNVENEISDLKTIIIRHIPENFDMTLIHDLLHTLSHFEKEQLDHARFEDKILIPKLIALQTH
ncbi:MAG: hemerythrin domain-containing protein [Bacteroidales bacterium]|nr:hemerythrin domain-containing protein [Bacteroidales bacterium]